jgi:hypothetical protein
MIIVFARDRKAHTSSVSATLATDLCHYSRKGNNTVMNTKSPQDPWKAVCIIHILENDQVSSMKSSVFCPWNLTDVPE